jgi:3-oxoacyl-[acyl-carrier protein] reductase
MAAFSKADGDGQAGDGGSGRALGCALVTGAGRGIGAAIAKELALQGRPVCVNYSADATGAAAVVAEIERGGGRANAVEADVSDPAQVDAMFGRAEEELGPVHVLVNNAGIRRDWPVGFLETEAWMRIVDVNLNGAFHTTKRALTAMIRNRFGRIVNVSSASATRPLPGQSAYSAAKAGLEALTRTVAIEVARRGVTVNAVAPGLVDTGFVAEMDGDWGAAMPPRRIAQPEEVAGLVRYLTSTDAAYVNGAVIHIDGGLTSGLAIFSPRGRPAPAGIALDDSDQEERWS